MTPDQALAVAKIESDAAPGRLIIILADASFSKQRYTTGQNLLVKLIFNAQRQGIALIGITMADRQLQIVSRVIGNVTEGKEIVV